MLIYPVCHSQNMDTAKFCGNCGNPFPRPAAPTSSLINCAQGHVYSAVYEHCPYCPQPESRDMDFATRVEEPITALDSTPYTSPNDFSTRIDANETLFETDESPSANPPAPPPAPRALVRAARMCHRHFATRPAWLCRRRIVQTGGIARSSGHQPGGTSGSDASVADSASGLAGPGSPHDRNVRRSIFTTA